MFIARRSLRMGGWKCANRADASTGRTAAARAARRLPFDG